MLTSCLKLALVVCPELTGGRGIEHLDIIRHGVGLRPGRKGGVRIDLEEISACLLSMPTVTQAMVSKHRMGVQGRSSNW